MKLKPKNYIFTTVIKNTPRAHYDAVPTEVKMSHMIGLMAREVARTGVNSFKRPEIFLLCGYKGDKNKRARNTLRKLIAAGLVEYHPENYTYSINLNTLLNLYH